jgi:hypothetical protein
MILMCSNKSILESDHNWPNSARPIVSHVCGAVVLMAVVALLSPPPATAQTSTATDYLSDRAWTSMTSGWGPVEKDRSNGGYAGGDGLPLSLNGVVYQKGLGAHAPSEIRYALGGACRALTATVGVDDEQGAAGSIVFQVWTDGVKQFDSGMLTGAMPGLNINVSMLGAQELALIITDGGDGNWNDHGDWADARVSCGADTRAPTMTATSPAAGSRGVGVSSTIAGAFSQPNASTPTATTKAQATATPVAAVITYDGASKTVTLKPSQNLAANTAYTSTIRGGVDGAKDLAGNPLVSDQIWTVSTETYLGITRLDSTDDNIQAKVAAAPEGAAFVFATGIYRMQSITPRTGQSFTGEAGAILSGARALSGFERSGTAWVASGQTQEGRVSGTVDEGVCFAESPRCGYPEDLFIDDVPLRHVATLDAGGAGAWYFDYAADRIYFWDDPTGKRVETSVTPMAFGGGASGVTISSLTIEKYAVPTQEAAVALGPGWLIESSEVRWNHFTGIGTGPSSITRGNNVHHNGGFGLTGAGLNILVENNEIAYNNYAGYNSFWGAGGSKWVFTDGLIVRGNFSHHNNGPGLWTDINNINTLYESNRIEDNVRAGIFHEISYAAIIRNNTLKRNGNNWFGSYPTEGGISICDSSNVEIYGNELEDNWYGIGGLEDSRRYAEGDPAHGPWMLQNLSVHNNIIRSISTLPDGCCMNGVSSFNGDAPYTSQNNRWEDNNYYLGRYANYFVWLKGAMGEAGWKATGNDSPGGTFQHP